MKRLRIILLIGSTFILTLNGSAQLKVKTDGSVKIGSQTSYPAGGKLEVTGVNETLETRIFSMSSNISRYWAINNLFGFAFGIDQNGYGHIYKNFNSPYPLMTFSSNGYVGVGRTPSYKFDVNGIMRVNTTVYSSDKRLKSNITPLKDQTKNLFKLNGVSYNFNDPALKSEDNIAQLQTTDSSKIMSEPIKFDDRIHYGFIAQEVQKVFPELVYEDTEGMLGVDYVAFIPLLLAELKEQNEAIEKLKSELEELEERSSILPSLNRDNSTLGVLYQNYPNPFNESTEIKYKLSDKINSARLCVYDLRGNQIKMFKINQLGDAKLSIKASELHPGMYLYSLIADGKLVDTKTMILTD